MESCALTKLICDDEESIPFVYPIPWISPLDFLELRRLSRVSFPFLNYLILRPP